MPLLPPTHEGYQGAPSWSPDGQWIAYTEWKEREWMLAKVRVGSGEESGRTPDRRRPERDPALVAEKRLDYVGDRTGIRAGVAGRQGGARLLSDDQWLVHTWSPDGSEIFGIRETRESAPVARGRSDARTRKARVVADLGPSPPVNNPVKGFSLSADGRTIATSIVRLRGDLWLLDGLRVARGSRRRLWPVPVPIEIPHNSDINLP